LRWGRGGDRSVQRGGCFIFKITKPHLLKLLHELVHEGVVCALIKEEWFILTHLRDGLIRRLR
jgi:hypothetical protein